MKRALSILLSIILVITSIPEIEVSAVTETVTASGNCGTDVTWTLYSDGELVIDGQGAMENYDVNDDDEPTYAPWQNLSVKEAVINSGVTSIGKGAFYDCYMLTSVSIPDTVTDIYSYAFRECYALTQLPNLPAGVCLGMESFGDCDGFTEIILPDTGIQLSKGVFRGCDNVRYTKIPASATFVDAALQGLWGQTAGHVGGGYDIEFEWTDTVGDYALSCTNVSTVVIPDTVKTIGYQAFAECTNLSSLTFSKNLTTIDEHAFYSAYLPSGTILPSTVTNIGARAFYRCSGLGTDFISNTKITRIEDYTFCEAGMTYITVPEGVTYIGTCALNSISGLRTVYLPSTVKTVGSNLFYNSKNIEKGYFNGTKTQLDAISGKSELSRYGQLVYHVNITAQQPENGNITVSETYPYLGDKITVTATADTGYEVLGGYVDGVKTDSTEFIVTGDNVVTALVKELPLKSGSCGENATWKLYRNGELIICGSGAMYNYSSSELPPWYNDRTSVTGIVIEEGITSIGTNAFYGTYAVTVDIPSTVKLIDDYAFEYSEALKSIVIPVGVETIGDYAFHVCSALEEVSLPDSLTTMEHAAFETCRALREITIPKNLKVVEWVTFHNCSGLTKVTIEEGVTTLNSNAFAGCTNLQTVYIPSTITTIDQIPFNYSTAIKDVYYNGSKTAWNNLGIQVPSTAVIHCTEYAISVGAAEKGTVSVDKTKAAEGDVITVTAEPAENYTLAAIYVDGKEINGKHIYSF